MQSCTVHNAQCSFILLVLWWVQAHLAILHIVCYSMSVIFCSLDASPLPAHHPEKLQDSPTGRPSSLSCYVTTSQRLLTIQLPKRKTEQTSLFHDRCRPQKFPFGFAFSTVFMKRILWFETRTGYITNVSLILVRACSTCMLGLKLLPESVSSFKTNKSLFAIWLASISVIGQLQTITAFVRRIYKMVAGHLREKTAIIMPSWITTMPLERKRPSGSPPVSLWRTTRKRPKPFWWKNVRSSNPKNR